MKRSAIASAIAAIGLLALSAAPADAAPVQRQNIPEQCFQAPATYSCVSQELQFSTQTTPSGVRTFVGKTDIDFWLYAGPGKQGLISHQTTTVHFNEVTKNGDARQFHTRTVFVDESQGLICTTITTFTVAANEIRHQDTDHSCVVA